jgi:hypothetical protein
VTRTTASVSVFGGLAAGQQSGRGLASITRMVCVNFARAIAHLAHLLLVPCELGVELLDLDLDRGHTLISLSARLDRVHVDREDILLKSHR